MKRVYYEKPKSSFLSVDKDISIIVDRIFKNDRLKKLLYYTTPDALHKPALTEEQTLELINNNIKLVPKLYIDGSALAYIIISCGSFIPNASNPEYRDNVITFDIICHFDQWMLQDSQQRPYKIAGELDFMLDKKKLTGIGELQFLGADQIVLNDEYAGLTLMYEAVHGHEDEKKPLNPADEPDIKENFDNIFNV